MRPLRLDQHILEPGADQIEIAGRAAGDEGGDTAAMLDREPPSAPRRCEDGARHPGFDLDRGVEAGS